MRKGKEPDPRETKKRGGKRGGSLLPALLNILGTAILLGVIATYLPLAVPRLLGYEAYHVVSGSMEPAIPVGSLILVDGTSPEEIREGDIIAFESGETVITHRVVKNRLVEGEITTKGDANAAEDFNTVSYPEVIGKVRVHLPVLGALMEVYTSTVGKVYVVILAACGAMMNMLASRMRERGREFREEAQPEEGERQ